MFAAYLRNFFNNTKLFFEENPTYFFIVLIALGFLVVAIIAYIIISVIDFEKIRNEKNQRAFIRTVLHDDEDGLFSVKMNISCEKITRKPRKKTIV